MGSSILDQAGGTLGEEGTWGRLQSADCAMCVATARAFYSLIFVNTSFIHKFLKEKESLFNALL